MRRDHCPFLANAMNESPFDEACAHDPDFERHMTEGMAASQNNHGETALRLFAQASALAPQSALPHFFSGSEHAAAGRVGPAEASFASALLLSPEFMLARYQLGLLQFSSQRAPLALLTWQPLLQLPDTDALLHFVRGFAALARDQTAHALQHWRAGLACQLANAAVADDIGKMVEAVTHLVSPARRAEEPSPSHVLLSGYSRGLH